MSPIIPYVPSSVISFILFLVVGLLVGAAIKKAVVSAVLMIIAGIIAAIAGLNILSFYSPAIIQHVPGILASATARFGGIIDTFPIAFLIGLAIGFWKG
ncbi:MAG: hypothetical protein QW613_04435 [Thermoprotei archaeon]